MSRAIRTESGAAFERCVLALCPPPERRWIRAMFAELSVVDGGGARFAWVAGAASLLFTAVCAGASRDVPRIMRVAFLVGIASLMATAVLAYRGLELLHTDDDLLYLASAVLATACAGLGFTSLRRILSPQITTVSDGASHTAP